MVRRADAKLAPEARRDLGSIAARGRREGLGRPRRDLWQPRSTSWREHRESRLRRGRGLRARVPAHHEPRRTGLASCCMRRSSQPSPARATRRSPGFRTPAPDPKGYTAVASRSRRERNIGGHAIVVRRLWTRASLEQRSQDRCGLIQALPALIERDAERLGSHVWTNRVPGQRSVGLRRADPVRPGSLPAVPAPAGRRGRSSSPGSYRRSARSRWPARWAHRARVSRRRNGRSPRPRRARIPSCVNRLLEPPGRERVGSELHQRQVDPKIDGSIVSDSVRSGWEPGCPLLLSRESRSAHGHQWPARTLTRSAGRDDEGLNPGLPRWS